jgi:autotransporter-associated beta strand protein/YVTN family beta-propeller protein
MAAPRPSLPELLNTMNRNVAILRLLTIVCCGWALAAGAASGTWTNRNGGSWTNAGNWNGGIIADGSGSTANFTTLNLPSDLTVTLDASRTIGNLNFDDQNATKHNWSINAGSSGALTVAGTTPTITVLSATTTINAPIAGSAGLTKSGAGKLMLGGANTYSGTTTVSAGTVGLGAVTFSATSPLNISASSVTVESSGTLNLAVNTSATAIDVYGSGALRMNATTNNGTSPDLYFGPNHSANSCYGARLAASLDLGTLQRYVFGKTGHNGVGKYGLSSADCQFAGPISGSGGLTLIAQNNWTAPDPMEVPFALNASNSFTGPIEIQRGSVYLGNANALTRSNVLTFNATSGNNARLFLYGNNACVSDLSSTGVGTALIANGNLKNGASLTLGAVTLTVIQNYDRAFDGTLTDTCLEYPGSGSGTTGPLNVLKNGPATLRLSGISTYSGTTTIAAGALQVDGWLNTGGVTVQNGAALTGAGQLSGAVTVLIGGKLAPGDGGLGILTINNALNLAGSVVMELSKTGVTLSSDQVVGVSTLGYGGSLVAANVGAGLLAAGDSFTLFTASSYNGFFTNLTLPSLPGGFAWDTSNLVVNGSIAVVSTSSPPVIISQPQGLTINQGDPARFSVVAAGARPLAYQWRRSGTNLAAAAATFYAIAAPGTNDSAQYSVVVTNAYGATTSLVATLTVLPPGQATSVTTGLVAYLNFDNNINAQAGTTNNGSLYTGGATHGPRYMTGIIGSAATFANTATGGQPDDWAITLGSLERVYSNSFSVSFWEKTSTSGDGALMGNKDWTSGANVGWVISSLDPKNLNYNAVGGTRRDVDLNPPFSDGNWHLVTVTFDRAVNRVTSYLDGISFNTGDISPSGTASLNAGFSTLIGSSGNGTYSGTAAVDDLGVWSRVLTPEEITGIYGAGLNNQPLTAAVPGIAPVITAQPVNMSAATGSTATLTVTATSPGSLTYQWRFNGANITGATSATLVLPSVSAASQGVYTVLVRDGSGAVLSSGAVLTVYELAVTGQWDFEYGDLRATVGSELEFVSNTVTATTFPSVNINGELAPVMAFGSNSPSQGFYMRHGAKANGGGHFVNQYTLLMDVMFPASSNGRWRALFQTDPFNHAGNDAEFYVGESASLPDANGIGAESQFNGSLAPDTWYRIAFAVDLTAPAGQQLSKYVNGVKVANQSLSGGVDGRYALGPTALLFTAGNNGGGFTQPGFVSGIQFVNGSMSPDAIAALGGSSARKLPPGNAAIRVTNTYHNSSLINLGWTGPTGQFQVQTAASLSYPDWQAVSSPNSNHSLTVPMRGATDFYRVMQIQPEMQVGQLSNGEQSLPGKQILRAPGQQLQFSGRPVDLALSPDGKAAYIKNMSSLLVVDAASWSLLQTLNYPASGASMHGIAVSKNGSHVYVTGSGNELYDWVVGTNGTVAFYRTLSLPGGSDPCGVAISADGGKAFVCLSILNRLAVVDLSAGTVTQQISVGIAPWDVALSSDGNTAYVSDWGGRFPVGGDLKANSAGTQVVVDSRGVAASGVVSFVNLTTGLETAQAPTGLHPSALALSQDGNTLYVANANSDTVTVIDTQAKSVKESILVRPDPTFPYGSATDGLALSPDGKNLLVATAGNNAIAVLELPNGQHTNSLVQGFFPTDWYPGAIVADSSHVYVANVKGLGSRAGQPSATPWQIYAFLGTANKIPLPSSDSLSKLTAQVYEDGRVRQIKETQQPPLAGQSPVPVPLRVGEPSVFQHVLYIIKENKTYDQMLGDLTQGNGDSSLCIYPQAVSPNHHALAEQYVLLDNFYCNGVNSADGHSWSTEGNNTDHLEKSFGGFSRSYTFGDDPLTYSSTGFIWNNALQHGLTFRNYGEFDYASPVPSSATWLQIYMDFTNGTRAIHYAQNIGVASLLPYSSTNVPGWNLGIPDVVRADGFIRELNAAQAQGSWATFHLLYLPNDHTGGPPTPQAQVADNDLALGRVVEAVTKSSFARNTVIFVIEDDPQSGYDHVDAHRSLCLVISPYTKRGAVVSRFYNQAGVLHTMEQIMGLPPMNQQDAMAPLMFDCFTNVPDFTPYSALPNNIDLAAGTSTAAAPSARQRYWAKKIQKMDFSKPDRINEDIFNRYIWYTVKGDAPYPSKYVGSHGKGLKQLGLVLAKGRTDDDD